MDVEETMYLEIQALANCRCLFIKPKGGGTTVSKQIQEEAKNKIIGLFEKYNVRYIDYDAVDDEYTIRLEKPEVETINDA